MPTKPLLMNFQTDYGEGYVKVFPKPSKLRSFGDSDYAMVIVYVDERGDGKAHYLSFGEQNAHDFVMGLAEMMKTREEG